MTADNLKLAESHFSFGENWLAYLSHVDERAIVAAEEGLHKLIPDEALANARVLDIGCGSGVHALAALRLGARELTAIDIDPVSVKATQTLLGKAAPSAKTDIRVLSVFDAEPEDLGLFDIVYSWGVLHHTGAMWEAVERASRFVRPGGLFGLALYEKCPSCAFWTVEKKFYSRAPAVVQKAMRGIYKTAFYAGLAVTGRSPVSYVRTYKSNRGMSFHHDVHDWMGGYPYESAKVEEVRERLRAWGFEIIRLHPANPRLGLFGTGCAEFTLLRTDQPESAAHP
jgi:2-polyprenyl-6-hydroxyphenyl methylase/3-demethylubiquinone-9 3-methyltransferase